MKKLLVTTALVAALATPALADDNPGLVMGFGAATCGEFLKQVGSKDGDLFMKFYMTWIQGAMSGVNSLNSATGQDTVNLQGWNLDQQETFIVKYCQQNPEAIINVAASNLYGALPTVKGDHK